MRDDPALPNDSLQVASVPRALRPWLYVAMLPLGMVVAGAIWDNFMNLTFFGSGLIEAFQRYGDSLAATLLSIVLWRTERRWRLIGYGVYLALAWQVILLGVFHLVGMIQYGVVLANWTWFSFTGLTMAGFFAGGWSVWRLCHTDLALAMPTAAVSMERPDPWLVAEVDRGGEPSVAEQSEDRRHRLWAVTAPIFLLLMVPAINMIFAWSLMNDLFLLMGLMELCLCALLAQGLLSPLPWARILAAGGCGYFTLNLGHRMVGDLIRGDGDTYARLVGRFSDSFSWEVMPRVLFYAVLVVMMIQGVRATVWIVSNQLKRIEQGRGRLNADRGEDDFGAGASWDQAKGGTGR